MVSAVSARPFVPPPVAGAVGNTDSLKPAGLATLKPELVARSQNGGGPNKGPLTTTPQFVQLMGKNPALRQVPYANYANSIRSAGGMPQPARPGAAYFEVLNGPQAGKVIDISKEKYPGKFMSPSTKIDLMEYGFGQLGLKKMGNVTINEFAKANTTYREAAASGSNTGEMRGAKKAFEALGDKAFPNGPPKTEVKAQYTTNPKKLEDLHPWLQGEVRSGRMTLEKAVEITKAEAERHRTMESPDPGEKTCITYQQVLDQRPRRLKSSGENQISTLVNARTEGWEQLRNRREPARSTTTAGTIFHPLTGEVAASQNHGGGPFTGMHNRNGLHITADIKQKSDQARPLPKPPVVVEGRCTFNDGTVMNSTIEPPFSRRVTGYPASWVPRQQLDQSVN